MLLVWALVAASGVFWGLKLFARPLTVPPQAAVAVPGVAVGGDLARLFGADLPPPPPTVEAQAPVAESSRFQLLGVVAARAYASRQQGVALIAVDGKTARAFRVGAVVDGDLVVQQVQPRAVAIGPRGGQVAVSLELPALPPPATGVPGSAPLAQGQPGVPGFPPLAQPTFQPGHQPGMPFQVQPPQLAVQPQQPAAMPPVPGANANLGPAALARMRSFRGSGPLSPPQPTGQPAQNLQDEGQQQVDMPAQEQRNLR